MLRNSRHPSFVLNEIEWLLVGFKEKITTGYEGILKLIDYIDGKIDEINGLITLIESFISLSESAELAVSIIISISTFLSAIVMCSFY